MYAELSKFAKIGFIVCEDGSRDNSKEVLRRLAGEFPIRLNLSDERKGYSRAVREGMAMLNAEYLLCVDSDGQCDPQDFANLWSMRDRADIVIGRRVNRADPWIRKVCSRVFYALYQMVFHVPVHDPSCPFVLIPKKATERLASQIVVMKEGFWWEFVARAHRCGFSICEVPVNHRVRRAGMTQVYKWDKMPSIFCRHVAGLSRIWFETSRYALKSR